MRKDTRLSLLIVLIVVFFGVLPSIPVLAADYAELTALGQAYLQDFNTLVVDGSSSLLPAGWVFLETGSTADGTYTANRGNLAVFDTYSYGSTGSSDRALGSLQGETLIPMFGAAFVNHTGGVITSAQIAYTGEQWRSGRTSRLDRLHFQYSTNATSLNTGTWIDFFDLDFLTVNNLTVGPKDGNSIAYRMALADTVSGLNIAQGAMLWIRWVDINGTGEDDGLAVDDFSLIPYGVDEPPAVVSLTPSNLATDAPVDQDLQVVFSEAVTLTNDWYGLFCTVSGSHAAQVGSSGTTFTLDLDSPLEYNETCTFTIYASHVSDLDTSDPPDTLPENVTATFTTRQPPDDPPAILHVSPVNSESGVSIDRNLMVAFSEAVEPQAGWSTLTCDSSGTHDVQVSGAADVFTFDPVTDFNYAEICTFTIIADNVRDVDVDDPPDQMLTDSVFTFTTENRPDVAPAVISVFPADQSVDVPIDASVRLNFSEPVAHTGGLPTLVCTASGAHAIEMTGGPIEFILNPEIDFSYGENCLVSIPTSSVSDLDVDDPPDHLLTDYSFWFSTVPDPCSLPFTPIPAIQGEGSSLAIPGAVVTQGVVVGDYEGASPNLRGFYLQDESGDANVITSDGIFVYDSSGLNRASVGDRVRVSGNASEVQGQSQVSLSEIHSCGRASVEPVAIALPLSSVDFLERYEGMLVIFPQTLYVTDNFLLGRFGQVTLSSNGRLFIPTALAEPGAPAAAIQAANLLNQIILDDPQNQQNPATILFGRGGSPLSASNTLRAGDSVSGLTGVLTYTWGGNSATPNAFRLRPVDAASSGPNFTPANPRPEGAPIVPGINHVVTLNLLNYFNTFSGCSAGVGGAAIGCRGAENTAEFERQAAKLVAAILAADADVLAVTELENDGYGPDSAIQALVDQLNSATFPGRYNFLDVDTLTGQVNALGVDAIKVGLLYQPARVMPVGQTAVLNTIEFINGGDSVQRNRASLLQVFENLAGARFVVNVNHLKSKSGACDQPDAGDGQGSCNLVRVNAVRALLAWLNTDPTGTGERDVLVTGDLNAYAREDPIRLFEEVGFVNLQQHFSATTPYTYGFNGQWGALDYALTSPELFAEVGGASTWAVNADEPSVLDYNTNYKNLAQQSSLYNSDPFRYADHDSLITGLSLDSVYPMVVSGAGTQPSDGQVLKIGIHQLRVQFNKDVLHDGGAGAADNPGNYRLVSAGENGQIEANDCSMVGGDDHQVTIQQVVYDPASFTATLSVNDAILLAEGDYRLIVCGASTIRDSTGNPLNQGRDVLISFYIRLPQPPQGGGEGEDPQTTPQALDAVTRKPPLLIPVTGFAPGGMSIIPRSINRAADLGDMWLEVPALGLKMPIVGVPRSGDSWDVSWLNGQAGWLEGSAFPTFEGNSVLTAHVWDALNQPGPFFNIRHLGYDDTVVVHAWGEEYIYVVREVVSVKPWAVEAMLRHEERAWLTLVTCQGFVEDQGVYSRRVLVRAVLVDVR